MSEMKSWADDRQRLYERAREVKELKAELESLREQLEVQKELLRLRPTNTVYLGAEAAEAKLAEVGEERDKTEEYAKEGWDWLSEALDALGAKTVFDIKARAASMDRARELAERERDATGDSIASSSFREIVRLLSGDERPGDGPSTEWGEGEAPGRDLP